MTLWADCVAKLNNELRAKFRDASIETYLAIKCPVKSLRRLPVENRINHVTPHIIFGWAHQRPWEILHAPKKEFCNTIGQ